MNRSIRDFHPKVPFHRHAAICSFLVLLFLYPNTTAFAKTTYNANSPNKSTKKQLSLEGKYVSSKNKNDYLILRTDGRLLIVDSYSVAGDLQKYKIYGNHIFYDRGDGEFIDSNIKIKGNELILPGGIQCKKIETSKNSLSFKAVAGEYISPYQDRHPFKDGHVELQINGSYFMSIQKEKIYGKYEIDGNDIFIIFKCSGVGCTTNKVLIFKFKNNELIDFGGRKWLKRK